MSKTFANLKAEALQALQDVSAAVWNNSDNPSEIEDRIEKAILEVSDYQSHLMREVFKIESRTGTADENKASALVDDAKVQFLATDVGKTVYNTTDLTWADVTAFVDTGELTLSSDIFPDGDEAYKMFNKNCRSEKEIYIGDITDYIGNDHGVIIDDDAHAVEYPLGTKRSVDISGDILTILQHEDMPDSGDADSKVEVFVWFRKKHRVSQLTDLAGTVNGAVSAGATTLTVAAIGSGTETIAEDTLFRVDISSAVTRNIRGTYRVTADKALTGGAGAIFFWPGLDSAVGNTAIITFIGSTLDSRLERLVVELTAAKARLSKSGAYISDEYGGALWRGHSDLAEKQLGLVYRELEKLKPQSIKQKYSRW